MERVSLAGALHLSRCPYCGIANPLLIAQGNPLTTNGEGGRRFWRTYVYTTCGGVVTAASETESGVVKEHYPYHGGLSENIPERPREFLRQARESLAQPMGAVMLCAFRRGRDAQGQGLQGRNALPPHRQGSQ